MYIKFTFRALLFSFAYLNQLQEFLDLTVWLEQTEPLARMEMMVLRFPMLKLTCKGRRESKESPEFQVS